MPDATRVAAVGDNCLDIYLDHEGVSAAAGNAVNVAVGWAALGRSASYFGAVGDDPSGDVIRSAVAAAGVDVTGLRTVPGGQTGVTHIRLTPDGDRIFELEEFGVSGTYLPSDDELQSLRSFAAVHVGLLHDSAPLRAHLAGTETLVTQDCAITSGFDSLDVAFCSVADADAARQACITALAEGARLCVVTRGEHGSIAHDGERWWVRDAVPVDVVDTTGAGDSFIAAFVSDFIDHRNVGQALDRGSGAAAEMCAHLGAWPAL